MSDDSANQLPWTGERLVPSCRGQVLYEHLHRYAMAVSLTAGKRVLDIACGEGYGANLLAEVNAHVTGVDIDPEVIAHAGRAYPKPNLTFLQGSCVEIPLPDHSVDFVVSFETIEHIDDHAAFLREIKRVLSRDGLLLISSPDKGEYNERAAGENPFHKRELYHQEFAQLVRQHFRNCRVGKQRLVAGSWIAPDTSAADDIFGTFSGDVRSVDFQAGVRRGIYSLALCSDFRLPEWKLGVYEKKREGESIWDLLDRFGSAEKIQNEVASLDRVVADSERKSAALKQLLAALREQLREARVAIARKDSLMDQLTADLRRQLLATKKLMWFMSETEKSALRLRSSRRWKLANPFAAFRQLLGGRDLAGYGHLEKIGTDYHKWRVNHPEVEKVQEKVHALEQSRDSRYSSGGNGQTAVLLEPLAPTGPIRFPTHERVEVSIIIPVFNQLRYTLSCLFSIQEQQDDVKVEVIVVDDCSTDDTPSKVGTIPGLVYLRNEQNVGFIASCNGGATKARGKFLLFLNNDTVVTQGWLSALLETFAFEAGAGLVGSKLVYPDGRLQEAGGIIWRDGSGWNRGKFDDASKPEYNYLCEVDYCSAASIVVPSSVFHQVGGFDSAYCPAYYEDTDLAFKIRSAGLKVLYQPLSKVVHFEGATGGTDLSAGAKRHQKINRHRFAEKWSEVLAGKPANGDTTALRKLSSGRKHILVIDHHLPMPDRDSGSLRMFQILCLLHALGHRLTFAPDNLSNTAYYGDELRKRGIEVIARPHFNSISEYLVGAGSNLDAVILSRCGTASKYFDDVRAHSPQARLIFDTVDLHFLRIAREAELNEDAATRCIANDTKRQELALVAKADQTWVVSEVERGLLLRDCPSANIEIVSNIVETQEPTTPFRDRADFLFIGSFLHPPNIDAVLFFAGEILPLVRQCLPKAKFYVIGNKPPPEIVGLESETIVVTHQVADVRPFFDSIKLSVAPLRFGAGIKGKINQSLGLGVPVVATSLAAEGMSLHHQVNILIADKPLDFAECLVDLYQSETLWNRLSRNGLETAQALYSPAAASHRLSLVFTDGNRSDSPGTASLPQNELCV